VGHDGTLGPWGLDDLGINQKQGCHGICCLLNSVFGACGGIHGAPSISVVGRYGGMQGSGRWSQLIDCKMGTAGQSNCSAHGTGLGEGAIHG